MKKIIVSDTTLRVQSDVLKNALSFRQRLNIAAALEKAGVDAIELSPLTGSKEDAVVCRTIAGSVGCKVCIPCGDSAESAEAAYSCVEGAVKPCLQVIVPISTVQMEYTYHLKSAKMLEKIAGLCKAASALCADVEFVAKDASRAEEGFAAACCKTAAENGASAVTLCDDGGVYFPDELAALVRQVKEAVEVSVYVQPSNALNMAAACAVEAIKAGADGVKTAAGCEEALSADKLADILRAKGSAMGVEAGLDSTAIHNILSCLSGSEVVAGSATQAVSDAVQLDAGCSLSDIAAAVGSLGYELSDEDVGKVYEEFRRMVERKATVNARELEAIVATAAMQVPSTFHLVNYVVNSGNIISATANITLEKDGEKLSGVSAGDGPIDAAFHAIEQIIGHHYELDDFQIQAVTKGREAVGSSLIRLRAEGKLYSGNGISTDIIGACIRAYINALNKIVYEGK
ncbi:MAG: hypothetical protein IJB17_03760 [Oscillospiraceae bacterium]|nr:hypothetical protein [Oscillospiraceae bacterium]